MIPKYTRGEVINGKYRLVRLLGEGGTSWVWVAENLDLEVEVAVKLIRNDLEDATIGERLLGEARSIARLGHPAIVQVFDFGRTAQGDCFIVMELLRGESLAQYLVREERMPATLLVQTLLPIVDALQAAHSEGIVHRDLKPDNIMIAQSEKGQASKLLDFGIAKLNSADRIKEPKLTQVGVVVGTPSYMSPEQARGDQDLDARSDIFALMTVFYECLTGDLPFHGEVYNAVMWSIIQDEPAPLSEHGVDEGPLWAILSKGLSKDREQRWQSAEELGHVLAGWLEEQGIGEDLSGRSLRTSWVPVRSSLPPPLPATHASLSVEASNDEFNELDERLSLRPFSSVTLAWVHTAPRKRRAFGAGLALILFAGLAWTLSPTEGQPATATAKSEKALEPLVEDSALLKQQAEPPQKEATTPETEPEKVQVSEAPEKRRGSRTKPKGSRKRARTAAPRTLKAPEPEAVRSPPTEKPTSAKDEQFDFGF